MPAMLLNVSQLVLKFYRQGFVADNKFLLFGAQGFWMFWFTAYFWREGVYMWVADVNRQWERDKDRRQMEVSLRCISINRDADNAPYSSL